MYNVTLVFQPHKRYSRADGFSTILALRKNSIYSHIRLLREQFRREAQTVANLDHPNIVRVLEFGVEGDTLFLVMNYASNGSLRQRHPRDTILPLPIVVSYVKQVADALQFAHDQKLIHQDV